MPMIDYKNHILIGVHPNGRMSVIAHWSKVPQQSEVQAQIDTAKETFCEFALCTPTSVMRATSQ
jgi:hypothetical protein